MGIADAILVSMGRSGIGLVPFVTERPKQSKWLSVMSQYGKMTEQVLKLLLKGLCDKEIVTSTGLSYSGVRYQIGKILRQYGVQDRPQLLAIFIKRKRTE